MSRFILIFLLTFFFAVFSHAPAVYSASPDISKSQKMEELYKRAKISFTQLESNKKLASSRDNWLICSSKFRKTYLSHPKSQYAPASLYMLGKIYRRMYERFNKAKDLEESISYYRDCATLFPKHRLADDALFAVGRIYREKHANYKKAAKYFSRIVTWFPNGDMHPAAIAQLMELSKEKNIALPPALTNNASYNLSNVQPVKYWSSDDYTRIVIKASGPVKYKDKLLEAEKSDNPRIHIDFKNAYVDPKHRIPIPISQGLLKRIRTSQATKDSVRMTIDVEALSSYEIYSLPNPFRIILDVRGKKRAQDPAPPKAIVKNKSIQPLKPPKAPRPVNPDKTATPSPSGVAKKKQKTQDPVVLLPSPDEEEQLSSTETPLSLAQQLGLGVKKIVLDPGHGGKDPGAVANGLQEKDIVLTIAKKLKPLLEKNLGCEVVMTRDSDTFISLEERTAIANANNADLFISLHINAHRLPKVHGIETYYLSLTTNAEAMRVAARENAVSEHQLSDLQGILSDIMKNSKINESSKLARHVHNSVLTGLKVKDYDNIKNLGVKQAPFYVLIGAEMPAILVEMAFISNEEDAKNLRKDTFLNSLAEEVSKGIRSYMNANTASL